MSQNTAQPNWFHPRGIKMILVLVGERDPNVVIIRSTAARLVIERLNKRAPWFTLTWHLEHSAEEYTDGRRTTNAEWLQAMFLDPLSENVFDRYHRHIAWAQHFGADVGQMGTFVRKGNYLNIPGPGIAQNGDPNISVEIDENMKRAIRALLTIK